MLLWFLEGQMLVRKLPIVIKNLVPEAQQIEDESITYLSEKDNTLRPVVGDIYIDVRNDTKAMIVAMTADEIVFGHGVRVHVAELLDENNFTLVYRFEEDL